MVTKPTVISTFAGCGGLSLGYKMAGFNELLAVEWEQNAVDTFRLNFPEVPVYHGDIAKLTGKECMRLAGIKKGALDVLDGSPPCQGFSTAGKRKFSDPRNSLFKEYARLLYELQPKVFVMENVTGMVKGCMKQAYLQIIKTLRECGYKAKGQVLNAMYYGVPQSRQRVILIGVRNDLNIKPSHPKPQTKPTHAKRIDSKPGRYLDRRWGDQVVTEQMPSFTVDRKCRFFWNKNEQWGIKSYIYALSFPDDFKFSGGNTNIKDRIGNSVPPLLMKAIAGHIKDNILKPQDS